MAKTTIINQIPVDVLNKLNINKRKSALKANLLIARERDLQQITLPASKLHAKVIMNLSKLISYHSKTFESNQVREGLLLHQRARMDVHSYINTSKTILTLLQ